MIRLRVKEVAQQKKISQGLLSRMANIDLNTIRDIMRNPKRNITLETLNRLANALKVNPCDLIEYIPDAPDTLSSTE
jgi:DNA-binding Xre family transcriptional regulator